MATPSGAWRAPRSPTSSRSSSRRGKGMTEDQLERKLYVVRKRAEAEIAKTRYSRQGLLLHSVALRAHHHLQGTAAGAADRRLLPGACGPRSGQRAVPGAPALLAPTRSPPGSWRIPTATSATTARSTRCAATSTGCTRAKSMLASPLFGDDIKKLFPIIQPGGSDSAAFDNAVELLVLAGRGLPHVMAMLIPEAWAKNQHMNPQKRAFYEYHASLMEPWDGPAAIAFTDGRVDRRHARSQRPAPGALPGHQGRPGHHGVGNRRAAGEAGGCEAARAACSPARCCWWIRWKGRIVPDEEIKRALVRPQAVRRVAQGTTRSRWINWPSRRACTAPITRRCCAASAPSATPTKTCASMLGPMADEGRGADRLDGHRHAAGLPLRQAAAAVPLLQAAVRAGHQSADRSRSAKRW